MYTIDSYGPLSASALTFVALVRYNVAGGMTIVGIPMYKNLGNHWALTLLAFISLACVPIPFGLYKWGPKLRERSKFAPTPSKKQENEKNDVEEPARASAEAERELDEEAGVTDPTELEKEIEQEISIAPSPTSTEGDENGDRFLDASGLEKAENRPV